MTRRRLETIAKVWQRRLKLEHWELVVDWSEPCEDGYLAVASRSDMYDTALIRVRDDFAKWSERKANEIVVHELLHLHERDLCEAISDATSTLNKQAGRIVRAVMQREREGLVDRLSMILVEIGGTA